MTIYEVLTNFNIALDKVASSSLPDLSDEQRDYFINLGVERFIKQRYGKLNSSQQSFEQTQKRTDDLSSLVVYTDIPTLESGVLNYPGIDSFYFNLPNDYWFSVSEFINIKPADCPYFLTEEVKRVDHLSIGNRFKDPFNRPRGAKTFRVLNNTDEGVSIQLFVDNTSVIGNYTLGYIRQFIKLRGVNSTNIGIVSNPNYNFSNPPFTYQRVQRAPLTITNGTNTITLPYWQEVEFFMGLESHQEIIDIAVMAALENLESPRQQSFINQLSTQE
jgi:hypothetical protein